jgi:putative SOS response-associated peptidase YedK
VKACRIVALLGWIWTGTLPRSSAHVIASVKARAGKWCFTAVYTEWRRCGPLGDHAQTVGGPIDSFTILTTAAGQDTQPIHNQQPVIVPRDRWRDWLDLSGDPAPLYRPGPLGTLTAKIAPAEGALL